MANVQREERWHDFRRRADYAPEKVYRHRSFGWEYVPVHPFGDEPDYLARLGIRPEDCWGADAWWGIRGDTTLLEKSVVRVAQCRPGLYARKVEDEKEWVYLRAVFELPFVTRQALESARGQFSSLNSHTPSCSICGRSKSPCGCPNSSRASRRLKETGGLDGRKA